MSGSPRCTIVLERYTSNTCYSPASPSPAQTHPFVPKELLTRGPTVRKKTLCSFPTYSDCVSPTSLHHPPKPTLSSQRSCSHGATYRTQKTLCSFPTYSVCVSQNAPPTTQKVSKEITRYAFLLTIFCSQGTGVFLPIESVRDRIGKNTPGIFRRIHRDASNGEKLIYRDDGADFDCEVTKEVTRMVDIWIS